MDLGYWGFSHWPFQRRHVSRSTMIGTSHDEAYARLLFVIDERRHCGSVTGSAGSGRSCLCRRAAGYARRQGRVCVEVDGSNVDRSELTLQIADHLHADCSSDAPALIWKCLQQKLANCAMVGQSIVVLIDNFDAADRNCGQVLRRLISLADSVEATLTVLLFSRAVAASPDLQDQIEWTIELSGWSENEAAQFVSDSLRDAGAKGDIFTPAAIRTIHEMTLGNPADVIRVCDIALLAAMSDDRRHVDAELVEAAVAEFSPRHLPTNGPRRPQLRPATESSAI